MYSKEVIPTEVKRAFSAIYTNQYDPHYQQSDYITIQELTRIMFHELDICTYSKNTGKPCQFMSHHFNELLSLLGFQYWHPVYETWQPNTAFPMILFKRPPVQRVFINGVRKKRVSLKYNKNIIVPFMAQLQETTNMFGRPSEYNKD